MIIGTAGHIDHGKSSLVRALTGTDPDRLKEEKARGITIDLGFATWPQPDGRIIGFVDVPGHERFVHTMLAGAHGIDLVLLVVAADDGVMPQTREHLAIIGLLGLDTAVVALTKCDLVDPARITEVTAQITALLAGTPFVGAPIIPVSTMTGAGMETLAAELACHTPRHRPADAAFRLAVDRSFSIAGAGTVVTGTILSGHIAVGDRVLISPSGLETRVRGLQRHGQRTETAQAGDRCAINLAGIAKDAIARGDLVLDPALHAPTQRMDTRIAVLPEETKGIGMWMPIRAHVGAAEVTGRAVPLESDYVQLVLDRPIAAAAGDRVVLRDISASRTIGGGPLLDLRAPERRRRTEQRLAVLAALDGPAPLESLAACPPYAIDLAAFARDHALRDADALATAAGLVRLGESVALSSTVWDQLRAAIATALAADHAANPDRQGMATDALRRAVRPLLAPAAFKAAIAALQDGGEVVTQGPWVRLPGHVARLAPDAERIWQRIAPALAGPGRFRPPRVRDFAGSLGVEERAVRAVLKAVARRGEVEEVALDHFFLRSTVAEMLAVLRKLAEGGEIATAEFRDRLGAGEHNAGRKVAIQALEFFDRHGVTLRRGEARRFDARKAGMFE